MDKPLINPMAVISGAPLMPELIPSVGPLVLPRMSEQKHETAANEAIEPVAREYNQAQP